MMSMTGVAVLLTGVGDANMVRLLLLFEALKSTLGLGGPGPAWSLRSDYSSGRRFREDSGPPGGEDSERFRGQAGPESVF